MAEREALHKTQVHADTANRIENASLTTYAHQPMEHTEMMRAVNNGDLKGTLDAIARNPKLSEPLRELARAMQNMTSLGKCRIEFARIHSKEGLFTHGRYDPVTDKIELNQDLMNHEPGRPTDEAIAHEVMHALIARKAHNFDVLDWENAKRKEAGLPRDERYKTTSEYKSYKKLQWIHNELLNDPRYKKQFDYASKNVHEMISEAFSNAKFQEYLSKIPYTGPALPKVSNMWQGFVQSLKTMLGFKGTDNALHAVLSHAATVADSYKGEALKTPTQEAHSLETVKEKPFSKSVPKDATVMLEHEDGGEQEVNARQAMRDAEKHMNLMNVLKECMGA